MPRKPTFTPPASPIPGVIPEPVRVESEPDPARGAPTPSNRRERRAAMAAARWLRAVNGPVTRARRR